MSTENVHKLAALGTQDASVRAALEKAEGNEAGAKAIVALGKAHGFDFTVAEALKVRGELEALSENDLAKVSGGLTQEARLPTGGGARGGRSADELKDALRGPDPQHGWGPTPGRKPRGPIPELPLKPTTGW